MILDTGGGVFEINLPDIGADELPGFGRIGTPFSGKGSDPSLKPEKFGGGFFFPGLLGTAALGSLSQMTQPATVGYGEGQVDPRLAREAEKNPYAIGGFRFNEPTLETNTETTNQNENSLGAFDRKKANIKANKEITKLGKIKELNEAYAEKEDKGFMSKLNSVADKIFTLQDKNPQAYMNIISGLDLYNRGQKGEKLGEALVGNSKFRNEQLKALLSNAYTQSVIDYNNSKTITALTSKAKGADFATSGRGLIPQLEDRITAEYFAGVDKETIPARQIAALSSLLIPDIEEGIDKGLSMNAAIDIAFKKAEETGAISKEKIIKDGGFMFFDKTVPAQVDASKFKNDTRSLSELKSRPSNQGKSDEEIKAAVEANGLILVD